MSHNKDMKTEVIVPGNGKNGKMFLIVYKELKDERLIASSLKSCISNEFTNRKSKALVHDLVNMVRPWTLH